MTKKGRFSGHFSSTLLLLFSFLLGILLSNSLVYAQTCNGISYTNTQSVCFGRGTCIAQDTCSCKPIYTGKFCQDYTNCTSLIKSAENVALFGNNVNINGCNTINGNIASVQSQNVAGGCSVTGAKYTSASTMYSDVQSAINTIFNSQPCDTTLSNPNFNSGSTVTLYPGVTCINQDLNLGGTLVLDSKGSTFTRFYIKISAGLNFNSQSSVVLTGGTNACNVFWIFAGSGTIDQSVTYGNFLTMGSVSFNSPVNLNGRILSLATVSVNSASTVISGCTCQSGLNTTFAASTTTTPTTPAPTYSTVCSGISSLNTSFVCSGHGSCIANNTCNCTSGNYTGNNCQYPICYGIASNYTSSVCSGKGACQSPNTCSCNFGWSGNTCSTCTIYDDCGVCAGTNQCKQTANDTYIGTHSISDIQITQFSLIPIPYAELTMQEKLDGMTFLEFKMNATALISNSVVSAEFSCISDTMSSSLNSKWITSSIVSPLDSLFGIYMFRQRISLSALYECYGNKFNNVITDSGITTSQNKIYLAGLVNLSVHRKNGTECEISFQNWISGQSDYGNVTYSEVYSVPFYFVISTSNTGLSVVQYTARGLGFSVRVFHKMWLQNGELAIVLKTCVNKPSGNPILLIEDSYEATPSTGNPKFQAVPSLYNGICVGGDSSSKCCQFWKYVSVNGSGLQQFDGTKYFRWSIQSAAYPILNGKTVETGVDFHITRPDNLAIRDDIEGSNFEVLVTMYTDHQYESVGNSFIDGYRTYSKAILAPLDDSRCNLFSLKIKRVRQCTSHTGSVPHSCDDSNTEVFLMYIDDPSISVPSAWDFKLSHHLADSQIPDCTSRVYMDWISRIVEPTNFTNGFLLEILWSYEYNADYHSILPDEEGPIFRGLMRQLVTSTSKITTSAATANNNNNNAQSKMLKKKKGKKSAKSKLSPAIADISEAENNDGNTPISTDNIELREDESGEEGEEVQGGNQLSINRQGKSFLHLIVTCPHGLFYNAFIGRCVARTSLAVWLSITLGVSAAIYCSVFLIFFLCYGERKEKKKRRALQAKRKYGKKGE